MQPVISVNNLSKKYRLPREKNHFIRRNPQEELSSSGNAPSVENEFWALRNISFDLQEGEVLGIIGKNGSGKSTLLKLLSRIIIPTSGTIRIKGAITSIMEIGAGFHPELTGKENISFYGSIIGMSRSRIKERFEEIVEFSGIGEFLYAPVKHYSSGMFLRLALSIAFHSDIKILLLDEVLSVGDAEFRMKIAEKIQSMLDRDTGITILMVSHSMNEVLQLCNRCIMLESGKKVFEGKASEVVGNYIETAMVEKKTEPVPGFIHVPDSFVWEWTRMDTAPGNETVKLHKVSIKAKERASNIVFIEDDIEIKVQFWKLQKGMTIQLLLLFNDVSNMPMFYAATLHNKSAEKVYDRFRDDTGILSMSCVVDGNLFNHGNYSMQVRFGRDTKTELYIHKELFHFKIQENPSISYFNVRTFQIALRPSFVWTYVKLS